MGYSIAIFGAFNVKSFGDSLFPKAIELELSKRISIDHIMLFSPYEGGVLYGSDKKVYRYEEFEKIYAENGCDIIIIGGGELFHNQPISFNKGELMYEEGVLWKRPIEFGVKYDIPVVLNGVGMPYDFEVHERHEVYDLLKSVNYIALRDIYSAERFGRDFGHALKAYTVPDTLWGIKDYYEERLLNERYLSLCEEFNIYKDIMILQYGSTKNWYEVVKTAENYAQNEGLQLIVVAVNATHEDSIFLRLCKENEEKLIVIDREIMQDELIALISHAKMFVGTSLHGNLTAICFGIDNIVIDMYPNIINKMDGLATAIGKSDNFVNSYHDLWYALNMVHKKPHSDNLKRIQTNNLTHYDRIAEIIERKTNFNSIQPYQETGEVNRFLKLYYKITNQYGTQRIIKQILQPISGQYELSFFPELNDEENLILEFPIKALTKVNIIRGEENIIEKNDIGSDIYIDAFLQWKLKYSGNMGILFSISEPELLDREKNILERYRLNGLNTERLEFIEAEKNREFFEQTERYEKLLVEQNKKIQYYEKELDEYKNNQAVIEKYQQMLADRDLQEEKLHYLIESDKELKEIRSSVMFKVVRLGCTCVDGLRIIPRFAYKNIKAFCIMMTHVNVQELKIAAGYVKNEGLIEAYRHLMRDYHKTDLKPLEVSTVDMKLLEVGDINKEPELGDFEVLTLQKFEKPRVSIVIPVYNQFRYTYYCIKSIIQNSGDIPYEVILADDCSTDLTTQIQELVKNLVVAKTETNLRFLRNCNNAAQYAQGEFILFLNNDTQVQKDWLAPLVDLCDRDASIGMVGSKLVYSDGVLQEAGGIIWKDGSGWNYGRNDDAQKPEYNYVRDVDYISGASIMIRKTLWDKIGGFDEYFAPAYCEDSDLAFSVRKEGYRVVYQPASVVVHFEGKSNGTDLNSGVKKYQVENSLKLQKKWADEFAKQYDNGQVVFKARERSKDKKVILVIDHYVPEFDKDAGSKTTFQYLQMFVNQGYSVKFIGDNFYQNEPYCSALQQMGVEVLYGPWYAQHWQEWILANKNWIDFAYLNRPHITEKYIDFLKNKTNIKCIYYGHDLHFLRLMREYEVSGEEEKLQESKNWMEKEMAIMRKADISYYPSYVEEEEIHKIDPSIKVKAITAYVYDEFLKDIPVDYAKREGILFVGGFGHPPNEDAVLWFANEVYPKIYSKIQTPFYIVGSKVTEAVKQLDGKAGIVVKGFVSEEELAELYRICKVVVVPLRYGAGVKGKVVEALYHGAPMVTTSVGAEGIKGIEDIVCIADEAQDFADGVVQLYQDNELLKETTEKYQTFVKDHFSVESVWKIVSDDFS